MSITVGGTQITFDDSTTQVSGKQACKAWVVFDGTGASAANQTIRGSYNVAYVYKPSTGTYQVNFTTAMTDINYSVCTSARITGAASTSWNNQDALNTTSAVQVVSATTISGVATDSVYFSVAVFN